MIFAEGAGHFDEVAFHERTQGKAVAELGLGNELDGLYLEEAKGSELLLEAHEAVVFAVELAFIDCGATSAGGDIFESVDAGHFFDEVGGALEIGAPAGDVPDVTFGFFEAKTSEDVFGIRKRNGAIHELIHTDDVELDWRGDAGDGTCGCRGEGNISTGNFGNECGSECGSWDDLIRIDSAFEAVGRIRGEEKSTRRMADFGRGEEGGFEEDVGGAIGDAAIESSHDASEGEGFSALIGNYAVD